MAEVYSGAVDRGFRGRNCVYDPISSIMDATLTFRGYTIEDLQPILVMKRLFLLWNDQLPSEKELASFCLFYRQSNGFK